jgi:two-component system response regulator AlgR
MIQILIIDDEPPARSRMKRMLESLPECAVAGEAGSARQALELIPGLQPDLLMLDISMPGMDGMTLARTLQKVEKPPLIIFCSAWSDQALEAFECDAVDYLVKPVRKDRLQAAINKVTRIIGESGSEAPVNKFLRSTVGGKTLLIAMADVICLIAEVKYTTVFFTDGKTVINDSLVDLEKRFPEEMMRIHRNALVAPGRIRGLEKRSSGATHLLLDGAEFAPEVSRRKLSLIRKYVRETA